MTEGVCPRRSGGHRNGEQRTGDRRCGGKRVSFPAPSAVRVTVSAAVHAVGQTWTLEDLHQELRRWERELVTTGKSENTVATYVGRTEIFLRWLAGEYTPR